MTWEEQMAAKARERHRRAWLESDEGRWVTQQRAAEPWRYDPNPPDDGTCQDCYEWRPLLSSNEYSAYSWWAVCHEWPNNCRHNHDHHDSDVALACIHQEPARHVIKSPRAAMVGATALICPGPVVSTSLEQVQARLAELEPLVAEDVKKATQLLVEQYADALRALADEDLPVLD